MADTSKKSNFKNIRYLAVSVVVVQKPIIFYSSLDLEAFVCRCSLKVWHSEIM